MTTELTKAAQQALKPHQIAQLVNKLRDIAREFHAHGCLRELISREVNSALTQRPAAQTERDTGPRVLREVFALCEDTMTKMESVRTEFSRGRAFEAKGISRAIGTWFQDEFCGRSHMGEPVTPPAAQAEAHPLASRCYNMSESHLSGHRLILGFETMEAAQAAHAWVANLGKPAAPATSEPVGEPFKVEQCMQVASDEFDVFLIGGCTGEPPRMSMAFASTLFKTIIRERGMFFPATPEPQQAAGEPVGGIAAMLREIGAWDHRGDTVAERWDELHGNGAFAAAAASATHPAPAVPDGWKLSVSDSDGRKWLHIESPGGAKAALSTAATIDGGRHATVAAQVLDALAAAQAKGAQA